MRINFKIIGGRTATLKVGGQTMIGELRRLLSNSLGIPSIQMTLIYKGVKLDNAKTVAEYSLANDATVNVMISKLPSFELKLHEYFSGVASDPDLCLHEFSRRYQQYLDSLNLDDIERISRNL